MQVYEERYPNNGLNRDDEERIIPNNESRYILNARSGSSEGDSTGAIENIKGTTQVVFDLPSGRSKVLGSYGDQTTHTNFFFLWNSDGNHSIYRYIPETRKVRLLARGQFLNFQEDDLINDINVVDKKLLKWRDVTNPPRKINIDKADVDGTDFRQTFHWYLGDNYLDGKTSLSLNLTYRSNRYTAQQWSDTTSIPLNTALTEKQDIANDLAAKINAITNINGTPISWKASACGSFVKIEMLTPLFYTIRSVDSNNAESHQVVPQNHYESYIERTIDAAKHPPHCELKGAIKSDSTFNRNYLEEKVFQFAAKYIYDDEEKSTVSPYSIHIYNKFICSQLQGNNINNYIEIDLSVFPELNDEDALQTIKQIELFVREGELGSWKSIKTLEQYEFVDESNQHFDFYNDAIYDVVDQDDFVRPSDSLPIRTKNQEVVKNRTFYANNLEGYDNVCIDAEIDVTYDDVESTLKKPTYDVSGSVHIRSCFNGGLTNNAAYHHQPIYKVPFSAGQIGKTVWGGISSGDVVSGIDSKTGQDLPLDGFVIYLAGTNYRTISKQRVGNHTTTIDQDSNGVYYDPSGSGILGNFLDDLRDNMEGPGFDNSIPFILPTPTWAEETTTRVASNFTIPNVPDGWYTVRVASHKTTREEYDDADKSYQRTSTNVFKIKNMDYFPTLLNPNPASPQYESMKEGTNELLVHVQGGHIPMLKIDIMDMSHASSLGSSKIATGYVVDADNQTTPTTYEQYLADTRVGRAAVVFNIPGYFKKWGSNFVLPGIGGTGTAAITDHNGYYFFASIASGKELSISKVYDWDIGESAANYNNGSKIEIASRSISNIDEDEYREIAIRLSSGASLNKRVKVKGTVQDNLAVGIPKASVASIRAVPVEADNDGEYEFWHYGILEVDVRIFPKTVDTLIFPSQTGSSCSAVYAAQIYDFQLNYPTFYGNNRTPLPNNATAIYPSLVIQVPFFLGDVSGMITLNTMKRGFDGKWGLEYYDRANRSGAVNTDERLKLHIPFYTEKDSDGLIKAGLPVLGWEIKHRPPSWATHYQWVRTRNLTVGSYFQWAIGSAKYTLADGTLANFASGSRLVMDIANFTKYRELFPSVDLEVGLNNETFRARFIRDSGGNLYSEYVDLKVLEVNGTEVIVEKDFSLGDVKAGTLVEFYNELLDIENDIYYEFGECFEVGTDANGNKYHKGLTQDQDPINPSTTPATGAFRSGDAYYRFRSMPDVTVNTPAYIDDDAVSDFYKSEVESIGRPNIVNPDAKQLWKPNQIRNSGKYIPDSSVNNMSQFFADSLQELPIEYGDINKLQLASNILVSIHELRWVSNYIEEVIMRKQGGGDALEATTDVYGSFRASEPITGTINPESVAEYRGNIWAFDLNKGLVNRRAADGLTAISEYKMIDYFTDKAKEILNVISRGGKIPHIIGFYDEKHNEYGLTFEEISTVNDPIGAEDLPTFRVSTDLNRSIELTDATNDTLYSFNAEQETNNVIFDEGSTPDLEKVQVDNKVDSGGLIDVKIRNSDGDLRVITTLSPGQGIANLNLSTSSFDIVQGTLDDPLKPAPQSEVLVGSETIAFSEVLNRWITFYSFIPEMYGNIDLEMLSFKAGELWIHNDNEIRNNFHGVQYPSQLEIISNMHPSQVKVFQAISVESYHPWHIPSMKTPNGMETIIVEGKFVRREDSFHAPVMRDINTPNLTGPTNIGIVNGRQLRDRTASILLQNDQTEEVTLFSVGIKHTLSPRHQT